MREIEFRGKCAFTDKWFFGNYAHINDEERNVHEIDGVIVIPYTVGQYTGLKDKTGKQIFEVDILPENNGVAVVIWGDTFDSPARFLTSRTLSPKDICIGNTRWDCCEVIGNIHDNPELLKEPNNG